MYERPYFIYEVVGVKVGCTCDLENRLKAYGDRVVKILEVHWDIEIASDREHDLQRKLGYRVDPTLYSKSYESYSQAWKWRGKKKPPPPSKFGAKYDRAKERHREYKKKIAATKDWNALKNSEYSKPSHRSSTTSGLTPSSLAAVLLASLPKSPYTS